MAEDDGTIELGFDVPRLLKELDELASKIEARAVKMSKAVKTATESGIVGTAGGIGNWSQSPHAKLTKELQAQHKVSQELLKTERMRADVKKAERFEQARARYGDDADLTREGHVRGQRRRHWKQRAVGATAGGISAAHTFFGGGGSDQSMVQAASQVASIIAPALAPVFNAISSFVTDAFNKRDTVAHATLLRWQTGGIIGADIDENTPAHPHFESVRKALGYGHHEFSRLYNQASRGGAFHPGSDMRETLSQLMHGERGLGIGQNLLGLYGAAGKTGSTMSDQSDIMGNAMALGLQSGIGRGRLGEAFDLLTSAIESNTESQTDIGATASRMLFISQLGPGMKGNTAMAREMDSSIRGLAKGSTSFTELTGLRAAGFGSGKSFFEAQLALQTGVDVEGGVSSEAIIEQNYGAYIDAYASGGDVDKARIVYLLSSLTGMTMPKVNKILRRLALKRGRDAIDVGSGKRAFRLLSDPPSNLLKPLRDKASAEDTARKGIGKGHQKKWREIEKEVGYDERLSGASRSTDIMTNPSSVLDSSNSILFSPFTRKGGAFGAARSDTPSHPGEDLYLPPGTMVTAPQTGLIDAIGWVTKGRPGNGMFVLLWGETRMWRFVHLDPKELKVKTGQRVERGAPIGKTLSFKSWKGSGKDTHLHLGVEDLQTGEKYDPLQEPDLKHIVDPSLLAKYRLEPGKTVDDLPTTKPAKSPTAGANVSGQTSVRVEIVDKTKDGVDVQKATTDNAKEANEPATGDLPVTTRPD